MWLFRDMLYPAKSINLSLKSYFFIVDEMFAGRINTNNSSYNAETCGYVSCCTPASKLRTCEEDKLIK